MRLKSIEQRPSRLVRVKQRPNVGLGATLGLKGGHALQRRSAWNIENHRIPRRGGDGLGIAAQALTSEPGPRVFGWVLDRVSDLVWRREAVSYTHLTLPTNREV